MSREQGPRAKRGDATAASVADRRQIGPQISPIFRRRP